MPIDKKWYILLFIPIIIIVIIFVILHQNRNHMIIEGYEPITDQIELTEKENVQDQQNDLDIVVDIKGEVQNPGVYIMKEGERVIDLINQAGGFTDDANVYSINLAQILYDEMVIIVPKVEEEHIVNISQTTVSNDKIRINLATKEQLMSLPGIGEQKALSIIEYRETHGPFNSKEELLNISGIGEKTLEKFSDQIIVP